jgi:hypothetical protein
LPKGLGVPTRMPKSRALKPEHPRSWKGKTGLGLLCIELGYYIDVNQRCGVRCTSITIMRPLLGSLGPALRLCSVMQQEWSMYRVHRSILVLKSSCIAELIIGLRPDPCSMLAYQLQRCADRTFSTRMTSSIFRTSTKAHLSSF